METGEDTFDPFNSPQLQGGIVGMFLTYLTCTLVTMTTRQFVRDRTYKMSILTSVRTINFLAWSIILFFMSSHIPVTFNLGIVFLQVVAYVWIFDQVPFSPCGVYNDFLESQITTQQTIIMLLLQFITAPISILLADFYLYYFFTKSHAWEGWFLQYSEDHIQFLNVPFLQAFIIEMVGPGLLSLTPYITKNKLIYTLLISTEVVVLSILFVSRTGFFINPLNATLFLIMYGKERSYVEWFIVYCIAPMLGTWVAVSIIGKRLKQEKQKLP
ncbi:hypothetical protein LOD99_11653 [Oopsacas minuta]|uniref:Uncharacterized protein n=1 Tax=Oopsacas minuta TaxID=111878 RepID=A0AAV7JLF1_9METZ|nr:hypothetical protein LOD99_11653 [Oopsacas minuta]